MAQTLSKEARRCWDRLFRTTASVLSRANCLMDRSRPARDDQATFGRPRPREALSDGQSGGRQAWRIEGMVVVEEVKDNLRQDCRAGRLRQLIYWYAYTWASYSATESSRRKVTECTAPAPVT